MNGKRPVQTRGLKPPYRRRGRLQEVYTPALLDVEKIMFLPVLRQIILV